MYDININSSLLESNENSPKETHIFILLEKCCKRWGNQAGRRIIGRDTIAAGKRIGDRFQQSNSNINSDDKTVSEFENFKTEQDERVNIS